MRTTFRRASRVLAAVVAAVFVVSATPASAAQFVNGTAYGAGTTTWTYDPAGETYAYDIAGSFADRTQGVAGTFRLTIDGDEAAGTSDAVLTVVDRRGRATYSAAAIFPGPTYADPTCWTFSGQFGGCLAFDEPAAGVAGDTDAVTATGNLYFTQ